jgi:hypothetical protein
MSPLELPLGIQDIKLWKFPLLLWMLLSSPVLAQDLFPSSFLLYTFFPGGLTRSCSFNCRQLFLKKYFFFWWHWHLKTQGLMFARQALLHLSPSTRLSTTLETFV